MSIEPMKQEEQRGYWLDSMLKIANPVLFALSKNKLRETMPVVQYEDDRTQCAHLEAFGRTLCGLTAWLEAEALDKEETLLQSKYQALVLACIDHATDPKAPDYMNFSGHEQALVDTAFFSHAMVRAPKSVIKQLDSRIRQNVISALKQSRAVIPGESNWLLFSAMVETALYLLGAPDYDLMRVKYALRQFMQWYMGDGVYGDGAFLHLDYYNSFVIVPMLVDICRTFAPIDQEIEKRLPLFTDRAQRHATLLERLISPEGTYPIIGRSVTYRFGAFQLLSQAALQHFLNDGIRPAQVRCALTAVMKRILEMPDMFDADGWLRHGIYGFQPGLGESYICTGSLYLCCAVFLPLGLPPQDPFWSGENIPWTSQKIVAGEDFPKDHAITI